jgi:hypothetical protein
MAAVEHSQDRLALAEALTPLPVDARHYVPALQNKSGELAALAEATDEVWERMTPLLHLVGPRSQRKKISIDSVKAWVRKAAVAIGERPTYLDVLRIRPTRSVTLKKGGKSPLHKEVFAAARKRQMKAIPVIWAGESNASHVKLVGNAVGTDGHGVAVRYRPRSVTFPPGQSAEEYLGGLLTSLGATADCADLLIDLGCLDSEDEIDPEDVAERISELGAVEDWRSVVLLGSSMPKSMRVIKKASIGELPRTELEIWRALRKSEFPRPMAFGDYAVQHPHPPADKGGPGMLADLRYTVAERIIVHRGEAVLTEGGGQYRDLCQALIAEPEFEGRGFSAGDRIFYDCARGLVRPGGQSMWRRAGTSHHMRFVTRQLLQEPDWKSGG